MRIHKLIRIYSLLFLLFSLSVAADAQGRRGSDDRWETLGRSYVDGRRDRDTIAVNTNESYRSLQLEVTGGTIEFQRVVVHFENGADHEVEIRSRIPIGGRTRVIDLPGDRRRIQSVEFWYSQGNWRSRPSVTLLGQRSFSTGPDRPGEDSRWETLGRSYVDGRRDRDTIAVNNNASYRALQLEVTGGTIEFQRVVVHFENGADHDVEIRDRVPIGGRTRLIDLPGDRRRIQSVEFWYSRGNWRSRPSVTLLGQRGFGTGPDRPQEDSQWEQLGSAYVDGRVDRDRILVSRTESFRALQLGVRGGAIEFQRVLVHFENGEDHELDIRERIEDRGRTRVIDLPGNRRRIRSVEFWYSKDRWQTRPHVNLWGRR